MKKLAFVAFSLFACSLVWGQSNQKILLGKIARENLNGAHPDFSYKGEVSLYTMNGKVSREYEDQTINVTLYNSEFEEKKKIQIPVVTGTIYLQKKEKRKIVSILNEEKELLSYNLTVETAKEYLEYNEDNGWWWMETKEDGTCFYSASFTSYFDAENFNDQYPQCFIFLSKDGYLFSIHRDYELSYSDEWIETEREVYTRWGEIATTKWSLLSVGYRDFDNGFSSEIDVSQTLFNDDEKYEYIFPFADESISNIQGRDWDGDDVVDSYEKYYGYPTAGFYVMSEDGNVLQTVIYDGDFIMSVEDGYDAGQFKLMRVNGKTYIQVSGYVIDEGNLTTQDAILIYEIDKQSNSIKQVAKHVGMTVRPTVADESEQITVDLSEESDASEIVVINTTGQTLKRIPVRAGQKKISFNAQGLSKGLNMVNARGGKENLSSKVLIK